MTEWLRLRHVAETVTSNVDKRKSENEIPVRLINYTDVYYGDRLTPDLPLMWATASASEIAKHRVTAGDVLITKDSETADDIGIAAFVESSADDLVCGYHLSRIRAHTATVHPRYLFWTLTSRHARDQMSVAATGVTRFGLRADSIRDLSIRVPPLPAQRAIADYLDTETNRIDTLITKKRRMIELQSTGFDALVRESILGRGSRQGPLWAGSSMATDRSLTRLGAVLELRQERNSPIRLTQVLSLTADRGVILYEDKGDIGNRASEDISRYSIVHQGDIVLNSMNVIIGSVGLSPYEGVLSPVYYVLKPFNHRTVDIRFLAYHFRIREFQRQLIRLGYGILEHRMRIPWINLKSELLVLPPLDIQQDIADELDEAAARVNHLQTSLTRSVDLLEERRQALIAAAITGELPIPRMAASREQVQV